VPLPKALFVMMLLVLAGSIAVLILLNLGWKNRKLNEQASSQVQLAGWLATMSLFPLCMMAPVTIFAVLALLLLLLVGKHTDLSARWMKRLSWGIVVVYWGFTLINWVPTQLQYNAWKEQTAAEDMTHRVPEPIGEGNRKSFRYAEEQMPMSRVDDYFLLKDQQYPGPNTRLSSIQLLHNNTLLAFDEAAGFGPVRMVGLKPLAEHFAPDATQLIPQPMPYDPHLVSTGELPPELPKGMLADLNQHSAVSFVNAAGFGYIRSRKEVMGFRPHRFERLPIAPKEWDIQRVELVSLLLHEKPMVYDSDYLPSMKDVAKLKTRELDDFEKDGLAAIRKGEELYVRGNDSALRVFGAMRSLQLCANCHGGQPGDVLGAFSYTLVRPPAVK
jgi:hypothetical protein